VPDAAEGFSSSAALLVFRAASGPPWADRHHEVSLMTTLTELPAPGFSGGAGDFARRGGQLRVSFTARCQLGCWFCHNEGEIPPRITHHDRAIQPRPRALGAADFLTAITTMTAAGIRRVFFTGGEPLLSPLARPVLEGLPAHRPGARSRSLTLGCRLLSQRGPR
jgi:GTP 3',8-cyclase